MRIVVHDFGGYPFPVELSRELARRGHQVMHVYCGSIATTPGGKHPRREDDPENLAIEEIQLSEPLNKYSYVKRFRQENEYGRLACGVIAKYRPDVVLSGNTPLDAQKKIAKLCRQNQIKQIFWLQDLLSIATSRVLKKKLSLAGAMIGRYYERMERSLLASSDKVVLITEDFRPILNRWGIADQNLEVIENWAPIERLPVCNKSNDWSHDHGLSDSLNAVYTGTLGMKQNPDLLLQLARAIDQRGGEVAGMPTKVVVVSEGIGANYLKEKILDESIKSLSVLDFQPFDAVPKIMATSDVLLAVLEKDAAEFSVPSKVLAYLCAGRAISAAIPADNLAARIIVGQNAGSVSSPEDMTGFVHSTMEILEDRNRRLQMGAAARNYAEKTFDLSSISDRFEAILSDVI